VLSANTRPEAAAPLRAHYLTIDNFLPIELAVAMRRDIDAHFARPNDHRAQTHQVWNYWHVPELYTYLRTAPEKLIEGARVEQFKTALRTFSSRALGMKEVGHPYLSLYVSGCRQNLHNDARNGRFAFVYSLTRNERRTTGGETIVLNEGDLFRSTLATAAAGRSFYAALEPRFNRLVIFDDRIPHGVERVDGSMDPLEGRFVLHGHLRDGGMIVEGALDPAQASKLAAESLQAFFAGSPVDIALWQGLLVVRLFVAGSGKVEHCQLLVDRVIRPEGTDGERLIGNLLATLEALQFQACGGRSVVIQPIVIGGAPLR
jgi:Rps23 Pro-64 3,4-dihydroxylase Tpa1-like proline 4-hydroxylase